jgi:DNA-directed RNA polymerase specialized sigma24 family protein
VTALNPDKLRAGDHASVVAFRAVIRRHVARFFRKHSQIEDVSNAALLELLEKLDAGARPSVPLVWALAAANNAVRRELTRLRRQSIAVDSQRHGVARIDPTLVIDARDKLVRIDRLLERAEGIGVEVLAAATEGATHLEIAKQVGVTPGAVRTTLSRVRADLREQLEAEERRENLHQLARRAGLGLIPRPPIESLMPAMASTSSSTDSH